MLKWALIFFVIAVVAGLLGFTGIARGAATISRWLFIAAIVIVVLIVVIAFAVGQAVF